MIRKVKYPTWVANVVLVKKANGKWQICVDFTNLSKACPKDYYPLPMIDRLVDATSGHAVYSLVDAISSYLEIKMDLEDKEKTTSV